MKAPLPYHFCSHPECHEMVPPGVLFCADHQPAVWPALHAFPPTPAGGSTLPSGPYLATRTLHTESINL